MLDWSAIGCRVNGTSWDAKVVYVTDDPGVVQATLGLHVDWIPSGRLVPIDVDPNETPTRVGRDPADEDY